MKGRWRTIAFFLVLGAVLGVAGASIVFKEGGPERTSGPPALGPLVGTAPVDFTLETPDGERVSLERFLGEKAVLLAFWATWCPSCNKAIPELNALRSGPLSERVKILAIDYRESREKVAAFAAAKNIAYTVLLDANGGVSRAYGITGLPTYILINREGRIVYADHILPGSLERYLEHPAAASR
jgi:peroxiredoxin